MRREAIAAASTTGDGGEAVVADEGEVRIGIARMPTRYFVEACFCMWGRGVFGMSVVNSVAQTLLLRRCHTYGNPVVLGRCFTLR